MSSAHSQQPSKKRVRKTEFNAAEIARALKAASKRLDEKQGISPKVRLRIVYGHDSEG